jgi:hypothetical protein
MVDCPTCKRPLDATVITKEQWKDIEEAFNNYWNSPIAWVYTESPNTTEDDMPIHNRTIRETRCEVLD